MSPLPNTAKTVVTIGGKPEGDDIQLQFLWADDQGKIEKKTGTIAGSQTVQTISNDNGGILASAVNIIVAVPNDGSYVLGPNGVTKAVS